jgi:minor extracellular serine protease Vpr
MKKVFFALSLFAFCCVIAQSQELISENAMKAQKAHPKEKTPLFDKCSPEAYALIKDLQLLKKKNNHYNYHLLEQDAYVLIKRDGITYVGAIIRVKFGFRDKQFTENGVKINSRVGNVLTCHIPLEKLAEICALETIDHVKISKKARPELDKVTELTKVDEIHHGFELNQPYFGKNVVVGIIDNGFDYTHPFFYDTTMSRFRIKRVWDQNKTGTGTDNFGYGAEYSAENEILTAAYDMVDQSHGTHIAGICAGGQFSTNKLKGIAPESDIVVVSFNNDMSGVLDAVNYIFDYAESVGKPAVINMSFGFGYGAFNGTEIFSATLDELTGPGKILVKSAGNDGKYNMHLSKTLANSDSVVGSFLSRRRYNDPRNNGDFEVISLGSPGSDYFVEVGLVNTNSHQLFEITPNVYASQTSSDFEYKLVDNDLSNPDTTYVTITPWDYDKGPLMVISVNNAGQDDDSTWTYIRFTSQQSDVHAWINYGCFTSLNYVEPVVEGDIKYAISDPGNGKKIITVGGYYSKNEFKHLTGLDLIKPSIDTLYGLSELSSHGPTWDGRTKPEISAPEDGIISSLNSFDTLYTPTGSDWIYLTNEYTSGSDTWYYGIKGGTSMASGVITGIVALMLEKNPGLTPVQVREYLTSTAFTDSYTGTIPPSGSNAWGWGKVNAHAAMKSFTTGYSDENYQPNNNEITLFPNPSNQLINIRLTGQQQLLTTTVFDVSGKIVISCQNSNTLNVENLEPGVYHVKIETSKKTVFKKVLVY